MKKSLMVAALVAVVGLQPAGAAEKKKAAAPGCPAAVAEAEQAIRFMTDVMVVSSTCQDTVYAEFRLRNQEPIRAYQKTLVGHFHGNKGFDSWNTSLANQYSQKRAGLPTTQVCEQAAELMKTAKVLDPQSFRRYAVEHVQAAGAACAK